MNIRSRLSAGLLLVVLGFASAAPAVPQTLDSVNVGALLSVSDAAFLIADKKGYFHDAGIEVKFTTFDSAAQMVAPLGTGQLDAGGGAPSAGLYNAIAQGVNLKIVADRSSSGPLNSGYGLLPLVVRKDLVTSGKFKTIADLKGMKVGEPAKGSASIATIQRLMQKANLNYSDVQHVFLGFPNQVVAFANGGLDASILLEPWGTQAVRSGYAVKIAGDDTWYPNQQIATLIYSDEFIAKRPDVAKRFMIAYLKGLRYYADALKGGHIAGPNAADVLAILNESMKVTDPTIFSDMAASWVDPTGHVNVASLKYDYSVMKDNGLIPTDVNIDNVVDNSFVDNANRVLGPYKPKR
jgi:NitT/TauT family transport system substrate-binding protein